MPRFQSKEEYEKWRGVNSMKAHSGEDGEHSLSSRFLR